MPFINGRFYANPAYGRALERPRQTEGEPEATGLGHDYPNEGQSQSELLVYRDDDGVPPEQKNLLYNATDKPEFEQVAAHQHPAARKGNPKPSETPVQRANRIYNETSGLRPVATKAPAAQTTCQTAGSTLRTLFTTWRRQADLQTSHQIS